MRTRPLLLIIVLAVTVSACGAQVSSPQSRGGSASNAPAPQVPTPGSAADAQRLPLSRARTTVQAYVDAWNRHDPAAICRWQSAAMRRWETGVLTRLFGSRPSCPQVIDLSLHPLQDNPAPVFARVTVARWTHTAYDGDLAAVGVSLHVTFPNGSSTAGDPQTAPVFLIPENGTWRVVSDRGLTRVLDGGSADVTDYQTPLTAEDTAAPLEISPAATPCSGARVGGSDPAGDVHDLLRASSGDPGPVIDAPWVDLRRVELYDFHGAHPCAELTFAQPVRAGTTIQFILAGNTQAFLAFGGAPEMSYWGNGSMNHPVGERGTTITYHLERVSSDAPLESLSVCASQQLVFQPLLDQATDAQDAWGHGASAPLGVCP